MDHIQLNKMQFEESPPGLHAEHFCIENLFNNLKKIDFRTAFENPKPKPHIICIYDYSYNVRGWNSVPPYPTKSENSLPDNL